MSQRLCKVGLVFCVRLKDRGGGNISGYTQILWYLHVHARLENWGDNAGMWCRLVVDDSTVGRLKLGRVKRCITAQATWRGIVFHCFGHEQAMQQMMPLLPFSFFFFFFFLFLFLFLCVCTTYVPNKYIVILRTSCSL